MLPLSEIKRTESGSVAEVAHDPKRSFLRDPGQAQTLNKEIMRFLLPYRIKLAPSTTTHR